ncbi:MAG: SAM-dependent methyltransferase, partial [Prevotella sp.]|nr:SAM-dependent methyltransferase [Prevotella sp.]
HTMPHADLIFIDPARRDAHGGRAYGIADCTPNVLEMMDEMKTKADRILIKLSPMLDWRKAVDDIGVGVSSVHIVSVDNECKELMVEVRKLKGEKVRIVCVNLHDDTREVFEFFTPSPFHPLTPSPSHLFTFSPLHLFTFLYSPNASIMKAGCFDLISERFGVSQLDKNSHLFVSDTEVTDFPGRRFVIDKIITMNKRELKEALTGISRANIAVRNFPMSVAELRKRLRLQEGGDVFIFATTVANQGHRLFVCRKIS